MNSTTSDTPSEKLLLAIFEDCSLQFQHFSIIFKNLVYFQILSSSNTFKYCSNKIIN